MIPIGRKEIGTLAFPPSMKMCARITVGTFLAYLAVGARPLVHEIRHLQAEIEQLQQQDVRRNRDKLSESESLPAVNRSRAPIPARDALPKIALLADEAGLKTQIITQANDRPGAGKRRLRLQGRAMFSQLLDFLDGIELVLAAARVSELNLTHPPAQSAAPGEIELTLLLDLAVQEVDTAAEQGAES